MKIFIAPAVWFDADYAQGSQKAQTEANNLGCSGWSIGVPPRIQGKANEGDIWTEPDESSDYRQKRAAAYPTIGDQADAILKWIDTHSDVPADSDLAGIVSQWKAVKAKYPKPA